VTQSLTDQRTRNDLIAELYDRHATGLFAYCADQLGDPVTAEYALVSVLSRVPAVAPPRAALYALARREIHRGDVVYAPPVVDPLVDPASALVERTLRELRPHQREVLLLCEVCGLTRAELGWVLEVAPDTAEELADSATGRFRQALTLALDSLGTRVPTDMADVFGALAVAPLRDILCRLPWPAPPSALRTQVAGASTRTAAPLFVKPLWPAPTSWPQPLADTDPCTATGLFPTELLTPRTGPADHEATTAPIPRLRGGQLPSGLDAALSLGRTERPDSPARRRLPPRPKPRGWTPADVRPEALDVPSEVSDVRSGALDVPSGVSDVRPGASDDGPVLSAPLPAGVLDAPTVGAVEVPAGGEAVAGAAVPGDVLDDAVTAELPAIRFDLPSPGDVLVHSAREHSEDAPPGGFFRPRRPPGEPVYRMPPPAESLSEETLPEDALPEQALLEPALPEESLPPAYLARREADELFAPPPGPDEPEKSEGGPFGKAVRAEPARRPSRSRRPQGQERSAPRKRRERHHDWAWEVLGFLICVAIAMLVFFAVPGIAGP
jgi:DNA-directed RNA polymerase specialized sigma24 family protein